MHNIELYKNTDITTHGTSPGIAVACQCGYNHYNINVVGNDDARRLSHTTTALYPSCHATDVRT